MKGKDRKKIYPRNIFVPDFQTFLPPLTLRESAIPVSINIVCKKLKKLTLHLE
jgi:hypothetical protein